jgi:hypothetical protein
LIIKLTLFSSRHAKYLDQQQRYLLWLSTAKRICKPTIPTSPFEALIPLLHHHDPRRQQQQQGRRIMFPSGGRQSRRTHAGAGGGLAEPSSSTSSDDDDDEESSLFGTTGIIRPLPPPDCLFGSVLTMLLFIIYNSENVHIIKII